jgi:toxin-antitoxin system PIN domain toxin
MKTLVDVNVVFAILVENHSHHSAAWRWWQKMDDESVGLTLSVRLGILRLLSSKAAMEASPVTPDEALAAWDAFEQDSRTFWLPGPDRAHELHFRRIVTGRTASPNLWTDAWLAAMSEAFVIHLASFDGGFRSLGIRDFELLKG